jgi:hypothetical protein
LATETKSIKESTLASHKLYTSKLHTFEDLKVHNQVLESDQKEQCVDKEKIVGLIQQKIKGKE